MRLPVPKWINVHARLPKAGEFCFIAIIGDGLFDGKYKPSTGRWYPDKGWVSSAIGEGQFVIGWFPEPFDVPKQPKRDGKKIH